MSATAAPEPGPAPAARPERMLRLENVDTFYGPIQALRGASLEVTQGSIVAILGANGAGKTTLLKTVMGLLEDQPDKGSIHFCGEPIHGRETEDIARRGIAFVPEGREVFRELTVLENLRAGAYTRRDDITADLERIFEYFPRLLERRGQWAGTLSGGEQQMLAIGRGMMARPKILLLDEPSLGLAPLLVREIFRALHQLRGQGMTIMLVEQDARAALGLADRAYVMETGRIELSGSSESLMSNEKVKQAYLGRLDRHPKRKGAGR